MIRITMFLLGFGLSVIGFVYIISYLNYLTIGYTFLEYLKLCGTKVECLLALVGIILISMALFLKGNG